MQWYDENRRRIDIAKSQIIVARSNPKENMELGWFLDSISAITDKNNATLFDIDIKETDCWPGDLALTPKKNVATLTINDRDENRNVLRSADVVSFIVKGRGNRGSENNIKMTKSGILIVCDENIDNIDVKIVEIPLNGSNIW